MTETPAPVPGPVPSPVPGGAARWMDSHCHLQDRYRPEGTDLAVALTEAARAGVCGVICVGTDPVTSGQAVAVAAAARAAAGRVPSGDPSPWDLPGDFGAWATVGLHPHEASLGVADIELALDAAVASSAGTVVAVGECGLDYHYDHAPRDLQRGVFAAQVDMARRHDLTLVVHSRDAWDDTLDVLRVEGPPPRTVLHCFTGGPAEARRCLELGAFLSFSGIVTFKGAEDVRAAAALCPVDRLLVETDAPFLAPVPHRGRENRPAWVVEVGAAVATVKGMAPEAVAESSTAATRAAFALV